MWCQSPFFVNIGSTVEAKIPPSNKPFNAYLGNSNIASLFVFERTQNEINEIIKSFTTSKACGPFSIPSKIIKEFSTHFVMPITTIGVFPQSLKEALVVPIFKKGDKTKSANYRPISLLSNISKIF